MQVIENRHPDPDSNHRIENSRMFNINFHLIQIKINIFFFQDIIKVIATLLRNEPSKNMQIMSIKKQFLSDLIQLCKHSRENRR